MTERPRRKIAREAFQARRDRVLEKKKLPAKTIQGEFRCIASGRASIQSLKKKSKRPGGEKRGNIAGTVTGGGGKIPLL